MRADDLMRLMVFGGATGTGLDWVVVFLFVAVGVVYFLAPVLGYRQESRGSLLISLYLLVGYAGLGLLQVFVQFVFSLETSSPSSRNETNLHIHFVFVILKLLVFLVAMVLFVTGLQALRLRGGGREEES